MRRRIPPLVGEQLIAPFGSSIHHAEPIRPTGTAVIVFWSAGCETSLHQLHRLAEWRAANELADRDTNVEIWTVHSPRFPCDEQVEDVALTMAGQRIPFPAIHDPEFKTWRRYNPEGWPTTVLIDNGVLIGADHGLAPLSGVLQALSEAAQAPGDRAEYPWTGNDVNTDTHSVSGLRFPQDVATDGERLIIADTGNDRVISGRIRADLSIFLADRVYDGLHQPTSVVPWNQSELAVVEGSRTITAVETDTGRRQLITDQAIRPGGLCVDLDGSLVLADSVANQILRLGSDADSTATGWRPVPIAGNGRLGCRAGTAAKAEFAQPVAVGRSSAGLVVADAASSAIRLLTDGGRVLNVTDADLYRFGLVDGRAHRAVLQRPTALCSLPNGDVIIVDGGNSRLRLLSQRRVETLPVHGLRRPGGAAAMDDEWLAVADTLNHRVVLVNTARRLVEELRIGGLTGHYQPTGVEPSHRLGHPVPA